MSSFKFIFSITSHTFSSLCDFSPLCGWLHILILIHMCEAAQQCSGQACRNLNARSTLRFNSCHWREHKLMFLFGAFEPPPLHPCLWHLIPLRAGIFPSNLQIPAFRILAFTYSSEHGNILYSKVLCSWVLISQNVFCIFHLLRSVSVSVHWIAVVCRIATFSL